jgi:glycosyltransferase involved in cell wall biosynthesis
LIKLHLEVRKAEKMRLIFGPEIWRAQKHGGISRYFEELIVCLLLDPNVPFTVVVWADHDSQNTSLSRIKDWTDVSSPNYRKLVPSDIYHATYYDASTLEELKTYEGKLVVTVFDMISELYPKFRWKFWKNLKRDYFMTADLLICISETTKRDLGLFYPKVSATRVVAYLGSSAKLRIKTESEFEVPYPYFVYVGNRHEYKNFFILLEALVGTGHHIICVGGEDWNWSEIKFIEANGLGSQVDRIQLADDELWLLMENSLALICTSEYEGFSLPVLEAITLGVPAICSDIEVHREIYGDAPLYFPVDNHLLLQSQLKVVSQSIFRENFSAKSYSSNFADLNWTSCKEKHLEYYSNLMNL